jgi:hypothetical protein
MGAFSDFQIGHFLGERLARASVTKTATLLRVSRATVSEVMLVPYTNHGKTYQRRGTLSENQH